MTTFRRTESRLVRVTGLDDLTPDEPVAFTVEGQDVLLVRASEGGGVFAIHNVCTHAEAYLDMGLFHADTFEIECPLHIGRFDVRSGAPTLDPCVIPVRSYPVVVEGQDVLIDLS